MKQFKITTLFPLPNKGTVPLIPVCNSPISETRTDIKPVASKKVGFVGPLHHKPHFRSSPMFAYVVLGFEKAPYIMFSDRLVAPRAVFTKAHWNGPKIIIIQLWHSRPLSRRTL